MRDLNFSLKRLVEDHRDGSFATRAARSNVLQQSANELYELGFRRMRASSLKPKHVEALVNNWQERELSVGTIKNRLAHLRWWAAKIGKPAVVARDNEFYQVDRRVNVTGEDKSRSLVEEKLEKVTDPHVRMSLQLQEAFGLRREEAIKFSPIYADRGDHIALKSTWTKGGKAREIPVRSDTQRQLLEDARRLAGRGALIPSNKNYIQQLRTYERNTAKAGLDRNHGLRHAYAQSRYEEITGWAAPARGGPDRKDLTEDQRDRDLSARQEISRELGHERIAIVAVYLG